MPLPEDRGRRGDGRPKVHRFRSRWLELGRGLREFRARYGLTQGEIAAVVGAGSGSAVAQWENGVNVPDGLRRERLTDLLAGRLWPALRAAALVGDELPLSWERAVHWYRRASRERGPRDTVGKVVAAVLEDFRATGSPDALRTRYCEHDGTWIRNVAARYGLGGEHGAILRRAEDAAYGVRWLEIAGGLRFDPCTSLVPQLPLRLLAGTGDDAGGGA